MELVCGRRIQPVDHALELFSLWMLKQKRAHPSEVKLVSIETFVPPDHLLLYKGQLKQKNGFRLVVSLLLSRY